MANINKHERRNTITNTIVMGLFILYTISQNDTILTIAAIGLWVNVITLAIFWFKNG